MRQRYDYIVAGAGVVGCVLAARPARTSLETTDKAPLTLSLSPLTRGEGTATSRLCGNL
jgi:hypothetical protein